MFGMNPQQQLLHKMRRSGIAATGTVTKIERGYVFPEKMRQTFGETEMAVLVVIAYKTRENTDEEMRLRISNHTDNPYTVGETVAIRYLFEKGRYLAIPEQSLHEQTPPSPSRASAETTHQQAPKNASYPANPLQQKTGTVRVLGTALLALGVFVVSAGLTVLFLLWVLR